MPAVSLLTFDENNPKALGIGPTGIRCDLWMDWFCWENLNRKPWIFIGFSHWTWGFPVNFPLNQSIESGHWSNLLHEAWLFPVLGRHFRRPLIIHPLIEVCDTMASVGDWLLLWNQSKFRALDMMFDIVWSVSPHVLSSNVWIRTLANCFARFLVGSHRTLQTRSGRDFITSILTSMQVAWQSTCGSG